MADLVQQKTIEANKWNDTLVFLIKNVEMSFLKMGELFARLKWGDTYKLVHGDETWKDFISSPEIGRSESFVSRAIKTYQVFIEEHNFSESDLEDVTQKKFILMLPQLEGKTKAELKEFLVKAKTLSHSDFMAEISEHEHDFQEVGALKCVCGYFKLTL